MIDETDERVFDMISQAEGCKVYIRLLGDKFFVYAEGDTDEMTVGLVKCMEGDNQFAGVVSDAFKLFWE
jgi:hypothetical protein